MRKKTVCRRCGREIIEAKNSLVKRHKHCWRLHILEQLREYVDMHGRPPKVNSRLGHLIRRFFNTTPYKLLVEEAMIDERKHW